MQLVPEGKNKVEFFLKKKKFTMHQGKQDGDSRVLITTRRDLASDSRVLITYKESLGPECLVAGY